MKIYDELVEIIRNPNWICICDQPGKISIIGGSGSGKTNVLLSLIRHQRGDVYKIYLRVKDPFKSRY